jgi:hypothetical protein
MQANRLLLRLMLAMLAATAGAAVLAVLTSADAMLWRLVMTCLWTAMASGLLMQGLKWLSSPGHAVAGAIHVGTACVCYCLAVGTTWLDFLLRWQQTGQLVGTTLILLFAGMLSAFAARSLGSEIYRRTAIGCMIAMAGSAALGVAAIWIPAMIADVPAQHAAIIATAGPLAAFCLSGADLRRRSWRWLGVVAAGATVVIAALGQSATMSWSGSTPFGPYMVIAYCVAIVVAHACLVLTAQLRGWGEMLRWATIVVTGMAGALVIAAVAPLAGLNNAVDDTTLWRVTGAFSILSACGTVAIVVAIKLQSRVKADVPAREFRLVDLTCPRCARKFGAKVGGDSCPDCRLRISVLVEEPRCAGCGYCLLDLKGDKCPECGGVIGAVPALKPA